MIMVIQPLRGPEVRGVAKGPGQLEHLALRPYLRRKKDEAGEMA